VWPTEAASIAKTLDKQTRPSSILGAGCRVHMPRVKIFFFTNHLKASDPDYLTDYLHDITVSGSCPKLVFGTSSVNISGSATIYMLWLDRSKKGG
jgi:hypothetical protein